jgi:hypothetical protein
MNRVRNATALAAVLAASLFIYAVGWLPAAYACTGPNC